jgi:hypothetical protein
MTYATMPMARTYLPEKVGLVEKVRDYFTLVKKPDILYREDVLDALYTGLEGNLNVNLTGLNPILWQKAFKGHEEAYQSFLDLNEGVMFADGNKIYQITGSGINPTNYSNFNQVPSTRTPNGPRIGSWLLLLMTLGGILTGVASCDHPTPTTQPTDSPTPTHTATYTKTPSPSPSPTNTAIPTNTPTQTVVPTPDFSGYSVWISSSAGSMGCPVIYKTENDVNYLLADCTPAFALGKQVSIELLNNGSRAGIDLVKVPNLTELVQKIGLNYPLGNFIQGTTEGQYVCQVPMLDQAGGPVICGADYNGNLLVVEGTTFRIVSPTNTQNTPGDTTGGDTTGSTTGPSVGGTVTV